MSQDPPRVNGRPSCQACGKLPRNHPPPPVPPCPALAPPRPRPCCPPGPQMRMTGCDFLVSALWGRAIFESCRPARVSHGRSATSRQVSRCEVTPVRSAGTRPRHPQSPFPPKRGGHTGPAHRAPALGPRGSGLAVRPKVHPLPPRGLGQGRPRSEAGGPWLSSVEGAPQALWREGRDPRGDRGAPHPRMAATRTPPLTSAWEPPGRSKD